MPADFIKYEILLFPNNGRLEACPTPTFKMSRNSLLLELKKQVVVCHQSVTVGLEEGLHLRPYSLIAQAVRDLDCDVRISNGDLTVDAVNVLDLMTLNANHGTVLQLEATGVDAAQAVASLVRMFESNFADDSTTVEE